MKIEFSEANSYGFFKVTIEGFGSISGCKYKSGTSAKGDYEFIAMPQKKIVGKDGADKWVSDIYLSDKMQAKLLKAYHGEDIPAPKKKAAKPVIEEEDIPF